MAARLKDVYGFDLLLDVTAVDWPQRAALRRRLALLLDARPRAHAAEDGRAEDDPVVDSLVSLYGSAGFMERECHDMYGIRFEGNPDLRPILLYEGFEGHPLRKDYPKEHEQPLVRYRCMRT
jgi:NADH-quinone oxidoreductase subunit C